MAHTNTDQSPEVSEAAPLLQLIDRSALLSPEQKARARTFAEAAGTQQRDALSTLLRTEAGVVQTMVSDTVKSAAAKGEGESVTKQLDTFFRQAGRYLTQSGEHVERNAETASAESLLDAA